MYVHSDAVRGSPADKVSESNLIRSASESCKNVRKHAEVE